MGPETLESSVDPRGAIARVGVDARRLTLRKSVSAISVVGSVHPVSSDHEFIHAITRESVNATCFVSVEPRFACVLTGRRAQVKMHVLGFNIGFHTFGC